MSLIFLYLQIYPHYATLTLVLPREAIEKLF